jgi:pimeloyl-ACP methyl ester carboxylesterase
MNESAPRLDCTGATPPVGYHRFHDDLSLNFQCNRWVQWIGASAIPEVTALAARCDTYPEWIDGFLEVADAARTADRPLAAAYYDRAAEFFMRPDDPRRTVTRDRFVHAMRTLYGVPPDEVPHGNSALPAYDLRPRRETGSTILVFGGFDSYVEEFLPMLATMVDAGHRVVAFDGPGQGGTLEEHGLPMLAEWERPVAAVLDHYQLSDVTAVGESLGGGLVIRAAAFEPRISRVVSMDILDDEFEAAARQIGRGVTIALRGLLAIRARGIVNAVARRASARKPVAAWGLQQGMHITGTATAYDFLRSTTKFNTRGVSRRVTADVLLLAGADDHYVPLKQLRRQAANLIRARSITTRTFTTAEQASNHCQVGNIGAAVRVIQAWLELTAMSRLVEKGDAGGQLAQTAARG